MDTLITNIGQLVTPRSRGQDHGSADSTLYVSRDVEIRIRDGRFVDVGDALAADAVDERIDAEGGVVLPGFIDPNGNLGSPSPAASEPQETSEWRAKRERRVRRFLARMLDAGITSVEVRCGAQHGALDDLITLQQLGGGVPRITSTVLCTRRVGGDGDLASLIGDVIPTIRRRRLARFCAVDCGPDSFSITEARTILRAARGAGLLLKLHGDGTDSHDLIRLAAELDVTSVDLLSSVAPHEAAQLKAAGVMPVVLPGHAFVHAGQRPDVRRMLDADLPVAIGSSLGRDEPGVGSMWMVLALAIVECGMTLDEAIVACTRGNAMALGLGDEVGTIEPGKAADVVLLDLEDYRELAQGLGGGPVRAVVRGGKVVDRS